MENGCPKIDAWLNGNGQAPRKITATWEAENENEGIEGQYPYLGGAPTLVPGMPRFRIEMKPDSRCQVTPFECIFFFDTSPVRVRLVADGDASVSIAGGKISDSSPSDDDFAFGPGPCEGGTWLYEFESVDSKASVLAPVLMTDDDECWSLTFTFHW